MDKNDAVPDESARPTMEQVIQAFVDAGLLVELD